MTITNLNISKNDQRLSGTKEIEVYCNRSWESICRLIKNDKFPAKKIEGRWESWKSQVDEWFLRKIREK